MVARDVSLTVRLLPDWLYYAVPYSLPGVQAALMFRLYSSGQVCVCVRACVRVCVCVCVRARA